MLDIKTLTSIDQIILDELRDIKRILKDPEEVNTSLLEEINSRLEKLETLIIEETR